MKYKIDIEDFTINITKEIFDNAYSGMAVEINLEINSKNEVTLRRPITRTSVVKKYGLLNRLGGTWEQRVEKEEKMMINEAKKIINEFPKFIKE